jgi:hypothetical protein
MPRSVVVGLLAAVGAALSALAGLVHSELVCAIIGSSALATGAAAYLQMLPSKKMLEGARLGSHTVLCTRIVCDGSRPSV